MPRPSPALQAMIGLYVSGGGTASDYAKAAGSGLVSGATAGALVVASGGSAVDEPHSFKLWLATKKGRVLSTPAKTFLDRARAAWA